MLRIWGTFRDVRDRERVAVPQNDSRAPPTIVIPSLFERSPISVQA